jgi:methylenetetrahydrofolate dehydrogenase (NADP+)/methenyltetrahydrofolate cyclohydrolase
MEGHELAVAIRERVRWQTEDLRAQGMETGLGLLLVGDDASCRQYFASTLRTCRGVGVRTHEFVLPADTTTNELFNVIHGVNRDERIHGLLFLQPLPGGRDARRLVNRIAPEKDVDGLGSISVGRLAAEESTFQMFRKGEYERLYEASSLTHSAAFLPCTPFGVIRLLEHHHVDIKGCNAVVVGKSITVGKPLAMMLLAKGATVTVCHRDTRDLQAHTRRADILCSATGVPDLIGPEMVREGAVVVDIGIHVCDDGRIVGDVDYEAVKPRASFITPVPGGVGPVTIAMLLENTARSARRSVLHG